MDGILARSRPVAVSVRCTVTLAELLSGLEAAVDAAPGGELSEGMADRLESLSRAVRLKVAGEGFRAREA
jgi:hypothetical protein